MPNVLDQPLARAKGSRCCCSACHVQAACAMIDVTGDPDLGFFGLCCACVPRYVCIEVIADYSEGCFAEEPIQAVTVEWDSLANRYATAFLFPGRPPVDIAIGFEQVRGGVITAESRNEPCNIVLASECMGYSREFGNPDYADDTRIFIPLTEDSYDELSRQTVCRELDVTFDVDIGLCAEYPAVGEGGCPAQIRIRPADFLSRDKKQTGFWDGFDDCHYKRACIVYTDPYGEKQRQVVCRDDYNAWTAVFPDTEGHDELIVTITLESMNPPVLILETNDFSSYPMTATCPDMAAIWELESGATISIKGDRKADCNDCRCWPRCLCIILSNDETPVEYRGMICWDEYDDGGWSGTLTDVSLEEAGSVEMALSLTCRECDGQTIVEWSHNGETHSVAVECPIMSGSFGVTEEDESVTTLVFTSKLCPDCFTAPSHATDCCENPLPDVLYATFADAPGGHAGGGDPMTTGCDGVGGTIALQFYPYDIGGNFTPVWRGSGYPFSGCPDRLVTIEVECDQPEPDLRFRAKFRGLQADPDELVTDVFSDDAECDPLMILFRLGLTDGVAGLIGSTCCGMAPGFVQYEFTVTITE